MFNGSEVEFINKPTLFDRSAASSLWNFCNALDDEYINEYFDIIRSIDKEDFVDLIEKTEYLSDLTSDRGLSNIFCRRFIIHPYTDTLKEALDNWDDLCDNIAGNIDDEKIELIFDAETLDFEDHECHCSITTIDYDLQK
jgi:hypothetical protein